MRILLLFPMADGQTGPAIYHAFQRLKHQLKYVDAKIEPNKSYKACCEFKPALVFCSRTYQLTGEIEKIKERFRDTKICMWNVDTRTNINQWEHLFPLIKLVDYYFVVASRLIPEWRELNPNTHWLPQGLQDEIYHKPDEITEDDRRRYSCDISFAGRERGFRREVLSTIDQMNVNFKKWGCEGKPKVYNEEHNKMVALSKINLCCSGWPENEKYSSVRNYKVMGAGGFVLELNRAGIGEIFPIDSFGVYESPTDLVNRIGYWLNHPEERKETAERGYKWVHANATYIHRIKTALNYMKMK